MKSLSFMLLSPALIFTAACSSSGGGGPSGPSIADKARGTHFSQAVIDDLKAFQAKSSAVLPDTSLITGTTDTERKKSEDKLNADGRAWLAKMQQNCRASTSGSAPTSGKGSGTAVVQVSGTDCPIQANTTTSTTNNLDQNGGSSDSKIQMNERILDEELVQDSSTRSVNMLMNVHADVSKENVHLVESGSINADLVTTKLQMSIDADISKTKDAMSMAVAVAIANEKGQVDLGIVMSGNSIKYYIGGREVTAQEIQEIFGSANPVQGLGLTTKAFTSR